MTPHLDQKLRSEYPELLERVAYLDVHDGWYTILADLFAALKTDYPLARLVQVKQKWGGLRVYGDIPTSNHKTAMAHIRRAEEKSFTTCEMCGQLGVLTGRTCVRVRCELCADES